jgi:MFS family permease
MMKLNPGVSVVNLLCLTWLKFLFIVCAYTWTLFLPQLLVQMHHIKEDEVGKIFGTLNFYVDCMTVVSQPISGFLSDYLGRKWLTCMGFVVMGGCLLIYPHVMTIYPGDFLVVIANKVIGLCLVINTPFLADYS